MSAVLAMRERLSLFSDRDAWLRHRATACDGTGLGASEVAVALGVSPHRGPWDLWTARRRGEIADEPDIAPAEDDERSAEDPSDPLVRGQIWEPFVRMLAGRFLDRTLLAPAEPFGSPADIAIVRSATHPWLSCSPDGWVVEPDGTIVPLELKTDAARGATWGTSGTVIAPGTYENEGGEAIVPPWYATQLYSQIECTAAPHGYIAVLLGSYRMRWFRLERDEDLQARLVRTVGRWRDRHLVRGEEPDRDDSDACVAWQRAKHAGSADGSRRATAEETEWIAALAARKEAEKAANGAKANLLAAMGTLSSLWIGEGRGVRRNKLGSLTPYGF